MPLVGTLLGLAWLVWAGLAVYFVAWAWERRLG